MAACIEKAEEARRQAAQLGAEWLATLELIEQAREQAELGELQRAMDLAELARTQSELATAQAARSRRMRESAQRPAIALRNQPPARARRPPKFSAT